MSKSKSSPIFSPRWIFPVIIFSLILIGYFTFRQSVEINVVSSPDQLPPTSVCPPTPYSFRVAVPCGDQMFRRASFRCQKPNIDFGTEVATLGDNKTCRSLPQWFEIVQDRCRTKDNCPILPPTPTPSPIPPIQGSCPPMPRCQPSQEMVTGDPIGGGSCPSYKCIYKPD